MEMVVDRKPKRLRSPKNKAFRLWQNSTSYPECHRFESYLSHMKTPLKHKTSRGFSYACGGVGEKGLLWHFAVVDGSQQALADFGPEGCAGAVPSTWELFIRCFSS